MTLLKRLPASTLVASNLLAFTAWTGPALSADVLAPAPVAVPSGGAPGFDWTGFHAGAHAGFGLGSDDTDLQALPAVPSAGFGTIDLDGAVGGLQVGYDRQFGSLVVGIEADIQATGIGGEGAGPSGAATAETDLGIDWYGSVRPRVGLAFDRTLVYATGGFAYGSVSGTIDAADGAGNTARVDSDSAGLGYAVGGGIEHALTDHLSVRAEYQFVHLRADGHGPVLDAGGAETGATASTAFEPDLHTLRMAVNYRF